MYTYDDVWDSFLINYKTEAINIPTEKDTIHNLILNSVRRMNNKMNIKIKLDYDLETVDGLIDDNYLLILAAYIKLLILENEKIYYTTLYQPMNADIGIRNYNATVSSMSEEIKRQEILIQELIFNMGGDFNGYL